MTDLHRQAARAAAFCLGFAACASHAQTAAAPPTTVAFKPFSEVATYPGRDAPAQAVALNRTQLAAEVSARVAATQADPGEREKTGQGSRIDVSMLESLAEWMGFPMYYAWNGATQPPRTAASSPRGWAAMSRSWLCRPRPRGRRAR